MFEQELSHLEQHHLLRRFTVVEPAGGAHVMIDNRRMLLMCSNDYLGLAGHPALKQAARAALEQHPFGSGASRLVSGTDPLHRHLEERIAAFKRTDAALLFNSGYAANTGIIPTVAAAGDVILSDSLNHASIIDGCRLSKARTQVYRHKDVGHVEDLLRKNVHARRTLIVTDGVFSMDGDIAPLPELVTLAEQYGALLMVDDAHATGVLGTGGRGTVEHFGLEGRVQIQMGTFGKALGSFGAYVAGDQGLIDFLVNKARSFIFSTALPPAICAASIAALDIVEQTPALREQLWENRDQFVQGLSAHGIDSGGSETSIIPVIIGDPGLTLKASSALLNAGVFATAIRPPTVAENAARIRTTVTALHTQADIDFAVNCFAALKREGYIPHGPTGR